MPPAVRVLLAGALFATGGALIKSCEMPSLQRSGLRALIAAITIFALLPAARRWPTRGTLLLLLPYFGATCGFVVANSLTSAANTIFMQSTAPFWVALLGPVILREQPTRREVWTMLGILVGMVLFFLAPATQSATTPAPRLGDLLALGAGLSFGLVLLGMRWLSRQGDPTVDQAPAAIAWGNAFTAPMSFALMPFFGQDFVAGDRSDWVVIVYLGTMQVGLAYVLLMAATRHMRAVRISLLLMIEPALNPVIAFAVHGEVPHGLAIAGGVMILAAVTGGAVWRRQREPRNC